VGEELALREAQIDVLINNAGALFNRRAETAEGLEKTFATNHMAYFVLTAMLRERLLASAPARIVNTASAAHENAAIDFANLQMAKGYRAQTAYGRSKLANILFTRALARRLAGTGVTANCLHPGFVATEFGRDDNGLFGYAVRIAMLLFADKPEGGADTIVHLAASPDVAATSGAYFYASRQVEPSAAAQDDTAAERLWQESARIAGIGD
jgi:NAD(P)-dependent dehydrogenase (short-subunit alcohol dehydrogenase family)